MRRVNQNIIDMMRAVGKTEAEIEAFRAAREGEPENPEKAALDEARRIAYTQAYRERVTQPNAPQMPNFKDVLAGMIASAPGGFDIDFAQRIWMPLLACMSEQESERAGLLEKIDPRKGLLVIGGVGTGKTTGFLQAREAWIKALPSAFISSGAFGRSGSFGIAYCTELRGEIERGGAEIIEQYCRPRSKNRHDLLLDDLGADNGLKQYGTAVDPALEIIHARYAGFMSGQCGKTYATTNLTGTDLTDRYGSRVVDRLKEMMNIIVLPEKKSFRR